MSQNPGGLIRWPVKMLLPAGLALLVLQAISELIKRIAFLTGHGPNPLQQEIRRCRRPKTWSPRSRRRAAREGR